MTSMTSLLSNCVPRSFLLLTAPSPPPQELAPQDYNHNDIDKHQDEIMGINNDNEDPAKKNKRRKAKKYESTSISIEIIGDALVDTFCYLDGDSNGDIDERGSLLVRGGDVRIERPLERHAGGSGLNTSTHLASLLRDYRKDLNHSFFDHETNDHDCNKEQQLPQQQLPPQQVLQEQTQTQTQAQTLEQVEGPKNQTEASISLTLQTALNETDDNGKFLLQHSSQHGFEILNRYFTPNTHDDIKALSNAKSTINTKNEKDQNTQQQCTGHCLVFVSSQDRSFITHLGTISTFSPNHIDLTHLCNLLPPPPQLLPQQPPSSSSHSSSPPISSPSSSSSLCSPTPSLPISMDHHHHIHIAGYFNLPNFANDSSSSTLGKILQKTRETRRRISREEYNRTTTVSLVTQYDATGKWDGGLLSNILPHVDFLIMNEVEASHISGISLFKDEYEDNNIILEAQERSDNHPLQVMDRGEKDIDTDIDIDTEVVTDTDTNANTNTKIIPTTHEKNNTSKPCENEWNQKWISMAKFFHGHENTTKTTSTYIIVTLGQKGAIALHDGNILAIQSAIQSVDVVDTTGAGDAFAAGFLHGITEWRRKMSILVDDDDDDDYNDKEEQYGDAGSNNICSDSKSFWNEAVVEGMRWGCAVGTSCVGKRGASVPSSREEIDLLLHSSDGDFV